MGGVVRMTPAQRREKIARELWPDYDARVARGRKCWAVVGLTCAVSGMIAGYSAGGFWLGVCLIVAAGVAWTASI